MGKTYSSEIRALPSTISWASSISINSIQQFVHESNNVPLISIGSGGSVAAAHFAALLHQRQTHEVSRWMTPLELLLDEHLLYNKSILFLSASGKNQDILAGAHLAVSAEVKQLGAICMRQNSQLSDIVNSYEYGFIFENEIPTGKDGYLATNSLLATFIIIARAYNCFFSTLQLKDQFFDNNWLRRDSAIILHAGWSSPISTDFESRMHESGLLNVQTSDYRNFGHGRHLWLSNRHASTFIIALITPDISTLANRTLQLVPDNIPIIKLISDLDGPASTIDLLVQALHFSSKLSESLNIDPGRPNVPTFGRRMFHLSPRLLSNSSNIPPAVSRKLSAINIEPSNDVQSLYKYAYNNFKANFSKAAFGAVVLDYDGTLVSQKKRYETITDDCVFALTRILRMGLIIGIATGRGKSVKEILQSRIPKEFWSKVFLGYFNGAEIASLDIDTVPEYSHPMSDDLGAVLNIIQKDKFLETFSNIKIRPYQITIFSKKNSNNASLYKYVFDLLSIINFSSIRILCSPHSLDLITIHTSKLSVFNALSNKVYPLSVLCIGDCGAWPGNDCELLSTCYSLSVDVVSTNLNSCWNLLPKGIMGPSGTIHYLNSLEINTDKVILNINKFK